MCKHGGYNVACMQGTGTILCVVGGGGGGPREGGGRHGATAGHSDHPHIELALAGVVTASQEKGGTGLRRRHLGGGVEGGVL
jgi:hypothetical protein